MDARARAHERRVGEIRERSNRLQLVAALALLGAIFHLACHALGKALLALCAGSFERAAGTTELRELGGLWGRMPATAGSCVLGALSLAGTPPLAGFWGPLMILAAAALSGHWVLCALIAGAGLANAVAMVRVQKYALFGPMPARVLRGAREVRADMWVPAVVLAALCLVLGLAALWAVPWLAGPAAQSLLAGPEGWAALLRAGPGP
jgi:formate hydrogenlyase subunit 3/multisubunit Na+/H+ antiporter MnhD subunit